MTGESPRPSPSTPTLLVTRLATARPSWAATKRCAVPARTPSLAVPALLNIERIVDDIDDIVRQIRFPDWQSTEGGKREVRKTLRRTLAKYKLHTDTELFEKGYGYVKEYYEANERYLRNRLRRTKVLPQFVEVGFIRLVALAQRAYMH